MTKIKNIFYIILVVFFSCSPYHVDEPEITENELYSHVDFLASDSLQGRKPGTNSDLSAAEYIRDEFQRLGLELFENEGFQEFEVVKDIKPGNNNSFSIDDIKAEMNVDYVPLAMSESTTVNAGLSIVGYGFEIDENDLKWNDYAGIDVEGKWLLILSADPETDNMESKFQSFSDHRSKVILARDKKAAGVIFVDGEKLNPEDAIQFTGNKEGSSGLPVIQVSRKFINKILKAKDITIEGIEAELIKSHSPKSYDLNFNVSVRTDLIMSKVITRNVIAWLPGNDEDLKNEFIVLGGHYDHLGNGGPGSGSRTPDSIAVHNGADDNASGIASIIEIAELVVNHRKEIKRSIMFTAFGAEELGLIGSKYFVDNPPFEISQIKTMVNIDMIGRLREDNSLQIGGTGSAVETENILKKINEAYDFKLALSSAGYGPSDHAAFYGKDIPVIFVSTGAHMDYHTPDDDIDKIDFDGMTEVSKYISDISLELSKRDSALHFQEAGPRTATSARQRFKVTLGIMPDFVSSENIGLKVDFVTPGKPAHAGGMLKGDIITALNGMSVKNIYEYMACLGKLKAGETITVEILRNKKKEVLLVQL